MQADYSERESTYRRSRKTHANLPYVKWKSFRRISKGDGPHPWRVEDLEKVHSRGHHSNSSRLLLFDPEGEAGPEVRQAEERKCEEKQVTSTKCIDGEKGWECKNPIEYSGAHGCKQRRRLTISRIGEDRGAIVGNLWHLSTQSRDTHLVDTYYIYTAELLSKHDDP